ncbi:MULTISPECIES: esterase-like activity of phytase family protein [unclassified Sphingomonas]|uniref:esterase-like activity of phytase family protein n=1 Tax=unclassified Sphingomonas TaxID=196159 RepID=UPI000BC6923A|nr:MAG: hypothetical protein B7Z43_04085 [Sphingomonas sp. 12-62-6]OYX38658.1 MAG: hypothetical protein B7Y98_08170 [Sphingomonas sp. 32-62-10]
MHRFRFPLILSIAALLLFVPGWSTVPRLPLLGTRAAFTIEPVPLYPESPARRRIGALIYERGYRLRSPDPAFGSFSSLIVDGDRFTLLSDGGNIVRFRVDSKGRVADRKFADLPDGPGIGWEKSDRDSESITRDPTSGTIWVGFENSNAIWAYSPDLAKSLRHVAPRAMRKWPVNGGAEAMVRLRDGSFIVLSEDGDWPGTKGRAVIGIRFDGDPTRASRRGFRFGYRPPVGYKPTGIAELPDGRLLVLNRRFRVTSGFRVVLTLIDPRAIAPGKIVAGRVLARFAPPALSDNYEGIAVVRESTGRTAIWIVSDDNQSSLQQSLLLNFRLDDAMFSPRR